MSFIDDLRTKAKSILWDDVEKVEEIPATDTASVQRDQFDEIAYDVLKGQTPPLRNNVEQLVKSYDEAAGDTYQDVFNLLNQGDPQLTDVAEMAGTHRINHEVMRQLAESDEVQALRKETAYDRYQTLFSMLTMAPQIQLAYQTVYEAAEAEQQAQQDLQNAMQGGPGGQPDPNALQQAIAAAEQAAQNSQQAAQDAAQGIGQGATEAKKDIDATDGQLGGYGLGRGEIEHLDYADRRALVDRLQENRMEQLAKLIGSFRSFGDAERRKKVKHAPAEIHEYILSNDLTRLVPEELNNLGVPELEDLFWLRWAQHGLLTRQVKGPAKAGQGPIIVVCDESGSMRCPLDGDYRSGKETREMWSKAVSLALCDAAQKGKRDFTYIGFSDSWDQHYEVTFPKGRAPLADVVTFTEHFIGGGTDPVPPLKYALEIIQGYDRRDYDKPDIVFISDGDFSIPDALCTEWMQLLDRVDAKCYGIQIGGSDMYSSLDDVTHHQLNITSLNATPAGVQQLFAEI